MKLRYQRLLYIIFLLIFLVTAPIIALYTTGYRYNLTTHTIEKTGILVIDSQPRKADIFINGKFVDTTPARFSALLPKTYQVRVSKNGYYPWTKELEVKSSLTTFSKNIVLFKNNLPVIAIEGEINILATSPNKEKIIYSIVIEDKEEIWLRNLRSQSDFLIQKLNTNTYNQLEFIEWSPNQNQALIKQIIGDFNAYLIVDTETLKLKEVFDITRLNFDSLTWDKQNDNLLYGLRKSVLYQVDLIENDTTSVVSDYITSFLVNGQDIYYITEIAKESLLHHIVLDQENKLGEKIKLPSPSNYTMPATPVGFLVLIDQKNYDLFIVGQDIFNNEAVEDKIVLQAKAKNLAWSQDFKKILFYTDFELWTYEFDTEEKTFINRFGTVIERAIWYPQSNYILYQTNNTLKVTETEPTVYKNDSTLAKMELINQILVDGSGENVYFKGKVGNQQGIYQLTVQ